MAADRIAEATWEGNLAQGQGRIDLKSSGLATGMPVTWASRTEQPGGKTSPEELLAAAHASCFAMAMSHQLAGAGHTPERLHVRATATFDKVGDGFRVTSVRLHVRGRVPGADEAAFMKAANAAKDGCPISQALKGNVDISLEAMLE
ncbi:MAG TPA: OsmC family peroxiredoxin [Longimicrobiales bacterium]|nr:OsmC family peroxiredoxin [Longimicrobiales bacterium]